MNIIGTGLSGLAGSRIMTIFGPSHTFENLSKETGVDIMDFDQVDRRFKASSAPWVFHFAAYTDVQGAEAEKDKKKESVSWNINVRATHYIADLCKTYKKHLLYISTDYVFDGVSGPYDEQAVPHPISWYGQTKYEGETYVSALGDMGLIIRINSPYRSFPIGKRDFIHKMMDMLSEGKELSCPSDQIFCPTFLDDLGVAMMRLVETDAHGIYHVCSASPITPYEGALDLCTTFGFSRDLVKQTTYDEYFRGKALPPKQSVLIHDKIDTLMTLHTFQEGIAEVKKQEQGGSV